MNRVTPHGPSAVPAAGKHWAQHSEQPEKWPQEGGAWGQKVGRHLKDRGRLQASPASPVGPWANPTLSLIDSWVPHSPTGTVRRTRPLARVQARRP